MVENKCNKWVNSGPHTTSFLQTECLCVCVCVRFSDHALCGFSGQQWLKQINR